MSSRVRGKSCQRRERLTGVGYHGGCGVKAIWIIRGRNNCKLGCPVAEGARWLRQLPAGEGIGASAAPALPGTAGEGLPGFRQRARRLYLRADAGPAPTPWRHRQNGLWICDCGLMRWRGIVDYRQRMACLPGGTPVRSSIGNRQSAI